MRLVYDCTLRKVGCVLLQATLGGDPELAKQIPNKDWLLAPTPDLTCYNITEEQFAQLVAMHGGIDMRRK